MADISCPACGAEDDSLDGRKAAGGRLALHCSACGHEWMRTPKPICPRCGSGDVEVSVVQDSWAFVDREAARDDPKAAFEYLDKEAFRCRHCNNHWEVVHGTSPPPGVDDALMQFIDDDDAYIRWLAGHYRGFVLNTYRTPSPDYLVLHEATCESISGQPARGQRWTADYIKICSMRKNDLIEWSRRTTETTPTTCGLCLGT